MTRILEAARRAKGCDLETWETALRCAVLEAGAKALERLLEGIGCGRRPEQIICSCGRPMESRGIKTKRLVSILGPVCYRRSLFQCPRCGATRYPGDEQLDVVGTTRSPGLRRMIARSGAKQTFKETSKDLKELAGVSVSAKDAERVAEAVGEEMEAWSKTERECLRVEHPPHESIGTLYIEYDGTGIPMVPEQLKGRKGKQPDGSAKTREAKLGCVFTQTTLDPKGRPVRDPGSTTFVGAIETAREFGWRIYSEALRRGLRNAQRVVVLGDGAQWVINLAQTHFPRAVHIIDLYHVREHVHDLCTHLFGDDVRRLNRYRDRWWDLLDEGSIELIVQQATRLLSEDHNDYRHIRKEIRYLERNKARMRYKTFKEQGLFIGSGVVEAGCKHLIGQRLKQSGMQWTLRGANAILSLRCVTVSGRLEQYWEQRVA